MSIFSKWLQKQKITLVTPLGPVVLGDGGESLRQRLIEIKAALDGTAAVNRLVELMNDNITLRKLSDAQKYELANEAVAYFRRLIRDILPQ